MHAAQRSGRRQQLLAGRGVKERIEEPKELANQDVEGDVGALGGEDLAEDPMRALARALKPSSSTTAVTVDWPC